MKIVSLNPALTDILFALHDGHKVVGVTHLCKVPNGDCKPAIVTTANPIPQSTEFQRKLVASLSEIPVDLEALQKASPSSILTSLVDEKPQEFTTFAEDFFDRNWSKKIRIRSLDILTLDGLFAAYAEVGGLLGSSAIGRDRAQRMKSQLLDWGRNLYERLRNKKVVVLSSVEPLEVAGCWVPDIIKLVSGRPIKPDLRRISAPISWEEVKEFSPDVILVAPRGKTLEESVRSLRKLEDLPDWDLIPAVKRGEVVFSDGSRLYQTGAGLLEGAGVLISAMAGLDSGYITKRDEFHRLRFVELHRHRFM
jgi:iron complex transport system substrate-binding protein